MSVKRILEQSDLAGQDLAGCSLGACDLSGKIFRGADLSHAHLGNANLAGADLRNANLYKANLGAANLTGADLRYADLREANMAETILAGADLREVIGLPVSAPVPLDQMVRAIELEETEDFVSAKEAGYFPLSHWGKTYALTNGKTLYRNRSAWQNVKAKLGDTIFGDRKTFGEVRLVQQYKQYSQWAYMISKAGFERIASGLGLTVQKK